MVTFLAKPFSMIENLLQLVKDFGENEVVNNPAVPNEQNNAVMSEASMAVAGTFQQAIANGNAQDLLGLFQNENEVMSNPLAQQAQGSFIDSITSKLGIDSNTAQGLAGSFLPQIIQSLVHRTNSTADADSGFNLNSLIGSLTGGNTQQAGGLDLGNLVQQFTGGGQSGGGGFDIGNLVSQFTSGAKDQAGGGNDLSGLIRGFFK